MFLSQPAITCSKLTIVNFEHVIAGWDRNISYQNRTILCEKCCIRCIDNIMKLFHESETNSFFSKSSDFMLHLSFSFKQNRMLLFWAPCKDVFNFLIVFGYQTRA